MYMCTSVCSLTSVSTYFLHKKSGSFCFLLGYKVKKHTQKYKLCSVSMITTCICMLSFHSIYRDTKQTTNAQHCFRVVLVCSVSLHQSKSRKGEVILRRDFFHWMTSCILNKMRTRHFSHNIILANSALIVFSTSCIP